MTNARDWVGVPLKNIIHKTQQVILAFNVYNLTLISGCGGDAGGVMGKKASKPVTEV